MEILLVTTELSLWNSSTDTADEVSSLARTFRQLGHDVTVMSPFDHAFERGGLLVARRLTPLEVRNDAPVSIYDAQLSSGARIVLVGLPEGADANLSSCRAPDLPALRAATAFAAAVAAFVVQRSEQGQPFDVVHLFDWASALAGLELRKRLCNGQPLIVLSVHDARRTGGITRSLLLETADNSLEDATLMLGDQVSLLRGGVLAADAIIAPSESHCDAWLAAQPLFAGYSGVMAAVSGGVDYSRVNPATNPWLAARYDAEDPSAKRATKSMVQRDLGLSLDDRPLVLFPGPLGHDAGGELIVDAIDSLLELPVAVYIWSRTGDPPSVVAELERRISGRSTDVAHRVLDNEDDAHRGFAAADFAVYPWRETQGQVSFLAAQRYGAIVIAKDSPGLRDAVVDCDATCETGTGFLFGELAAPALVGAVSRALSVYAQPSFAKLRRRVMRQDLGWERPARRLLQIYKKGRSGKAKDSPTDL